MTSDVHEIHNLLADYCLAADEGRAEDWARCFTKDGEMHSFGNVWKGFDSLAENIRAAPGGLHLCGIPRIAIDGDRADVEVGFAFITHDRQIWSMGKYVDELARTPDGWRIARREAHFLKPPKTG